MDLPAEQEDALAQLLRAAEIDSSNPARWKALGDACVALGLAEAAALAFGMVDTIDMAKRTEKAWDAARGNMLPVAETILRELHDAYPDDEDTIGHLSGMLLRNGKQEEALELAGKGLARHPKSPRIWEAWILALAGVGKWGEAQEACREALRFMAFRDPAGLPGARLLSLRGWIEIHLGNHAVGEAMVWKAFLDAPQDNEIHQRVAAMMQSSCNLRSILVQMEQNLEAYSENENYITLLGDAYRYCFEHEKALRVYRSGKHATKPLLLRMAKVEEYLGNLTRAREHFDTLLRVFPANTHTLAIFMMFLRRTAQWKEYDAVLRCKLEANHADVSYWQTTGSLYSMLNDWNNARAAYEKALACCAEPDKKDILRTLGKLYIQLEQLDKAASMCRELCGIDTRDGLELSFLLVKASSAQHREESFPAQDFWNNELANHVHEPFSIEPVKNQGSEKLTCRITLDSGKSLIVFWEPKEGRVRRAITVLRHLVGRGVAVPGLAFFDLGKKYYAVEDLGSVTGADILDANPGDKNVLEKIARLIAGIHASGTGDIARTLPQDNFFFSIRKQLLRTVEQFFECYAMVCRRPPAPSMRREIWQLAKQYPVLGGFAFMHGDFKASNMMFVRDDFFAIDTQSACFGSGVWEIGMLCNEYCFDLDFFCHSYGAALSGFGLTYSPSPADAVLSSQQSVLGLSLLHIASVWLSNPRGPQRVSELFERWRGRPGFQKAPVLEDCLSEMTCCLKCRNVS
jgi:Phosphotransferase enzyme family.